MLEIFLFLTFIFLNPCSNTFKFSSHDCTGFVCSLNHLLNVLNLFFGTKGFIIPDKWNHTFRYGIDLIYKPGFSFISL